MSANGPFECAKPHMRAARNWRCCPGRGAHGSTSSRRGDLCRRCHRILSHASAAWRALADCCWEPPLGMARLDLPRVLCLKCAAGVQMFRQNGLIQTGDTCMVALRCPHLACTHASCLFHHSARHNTVVCSFFLFFELLTSSIHQQQSPSEASKTTVIALKKHAKTTQARQPKMKQNRGRFPEHLGKPCFCSFRRKCGCAFPYRNKHIRKID